MVKLEEPKISMLINQEGTTIELFDSKSSRTFARVMLTNDQLATMLSRLHRTECEIELDNLDLIGKQREVKYFAFEIHKDAQNHKDILHQKCLEELHNKGMLEWVPDCAYSSRNSFFTEDGKSYARTIIRRWV